MPIPRGLALRALCNDVDLAVVVAMAIVLVVQVTVDEVVDVIAVRDGGMTAIGTMHMVCSMTTACVPISAFAGIQRVDFERMLLHDTGSRLMMQMAIVQVIDMVAMLDGRVPALGAVNVVMIRVFV